MKRFCLLLAAAAWPAIGAINVTIDNFPSSSGGTFSGGVWTPTASPSRIDIDDLLIQLSFTNVTINTFGGLLEAGTIQMLEGININALPAGSTRTLTLNAEDDIILSGYTMDTNPATTQTLHIVGNANLGTGAGDIIITEDILLESGSMTLNARNNTKWLNAHIRANPITINSTLNTELFTGLVESVGADIRLAGNAIRIFSDIQSGGGDIFIDSTVGAVTVTAARVDASGGDGFGRVNVDTSNNRIFINTNALVMSGPYGAVAFSNLTGNASNQDILGAVIGGAAGVQLRAGNNLNILGPVSATGPVRLNGDANLGGIGETWIDAPVTSWSGSVQVIAARYITSQVAGVIHAAGDVNYQLYYNGGMQLGGDVVAGGEVRAAALHSIVVSGGISAGGLIEFESRSSNLVVNGSLSSGTGGVRLLTRSLFGVLRAESPIQTAGGDVLLTGMGIVELSGGVETGGGNLTLLSTNTGPIRIGGAVPVTLDLSGGGGSGSLMVTNVTGAVSVNSNVTIISGAGGGAALFGRFGSDCDVTVSGAVHAGTSGLILSSDDEVIVAAACISAGPVSLIGDANIGGVGPLSVNALLLASGQQVELKGSRIEVNQPIVASGGGVTIASQGGAAINAPVFGAATFNSSGVTTIEVASVGSDGFTIQNGKVVFSNPFIAPDVAFYQAGAGTELGLRIAGPVTGIYNRLVMPGTAALDGTVSAVFEPGFVPAPGDVFQLLDFGQSLGVCSLSLPALPAGRFWDISRFFSDGVVAVTDGPPGYTTWAQFYGAGGPGDDEGGDGWLNGFDYALGFTPADPRADLLPTAYLAGPPGSQRLILTFYTPVLDRPDVEYEMQASSTAADEAAWTTVTRRYPGGLWTGAPVVSVGPVVNGYQKVEIWDDVVSATGRFVRLSVNIIEQP